MRSLQKSVLVGLLRHCIPALAILAEDFSALPRLTYDFVVVGGGTAGSVIASRLSENPKFNVLLIESGPQYDGYPDTTVPAYMYRLFRTELDWAYTSIPQIGLNNRTQDIPRGRILGGSSSINGQVYTRGSADDWNRYADVTGDSGWAWDNILPYFLKSEKWSKPSDGRSTDGKYDPAFHSKSGVLGVSLSGSPQALDAKMVQASQELGNEYSPGLDMNDGTPLGFGWTQSTVENGTRVSAATAYLGSSQVSRRNLHVLVRHRVLKLHQTGKEVNKRGPVFRTISFVKENSTSSANYRVTASKEVFVCAGTFGTPKVLLLSGIGDGQELSTTNIKPKVYLPSVGKNLSDHVQLKLTWQLGINDTVDVVNNQTLQDELLVRWRKDRSGPLSSYGLNSIIWSRLPEDWKHWDTFDDPAAGNVTPHYELLVFNRGLYPQPAPMLDTWTILSTPKSRGTVSLNSSNPLGNPLIDLGFLKSDFDVLVLREGAKAMNKLMSATPWAEWNLSQVIPSIEVQSDEDFHDFIRNTATQGYHPVGTAMMSRANASYGVVDPDLKVKKISGLRIVDASVLPYVPAGHTQAHIYALAERAADLVKATWGSLDP